MSPFAEDFVITDIYICSLKQQYREICVKMQQYLCELHLCIDEGERVWIGYNEKDCLLRNPQTNIL